MDCCSYLNCTITTDDPEKDGNDRNDKQDVDDAGGFIGEKADGPGDDQNHCDKVEQT